MSPLRSTMTSVPYLINVLAREDHDHVVEDAESDERDSIVREQLLQLRYRRLV